MDLALLAQAALAELGLDEEGDLERRRRALVGHPGDADDDPAAGERVERGAQPGGGLGGVEVMGLGVEVLDRLGHDARAGREDELVVAERQAVASGSTTWRASSTRATSPTTSVTRLSSSERSGRSRLAARSPPIAMYMKPGW